MSNSIQLIHNICPYLKILKRVISHIYLVPVLQSINTGWYNQWVSLNRGLTYDCKTGPY